MTTLKEALGLSEDFSGLATDTTSYLGGSRTHTFGLGTPVRYVAEIGKTQIEASTTFLGGSLSRLSLIERSGPEGNYFMLNGSLRNVKMTNTVVLDNEEMSIAAMLLKLVNEGLSDDQKITLDRFVEIVGRYGWDIDNRNNGMGLTFMHFRVDQSKIEEIFDWFSSNGAEDRTHTITNLNGIIKVLALPDGASLPVESFRASSMDRTRTQDGSGWVSFVDAAYGNFARFVAKRAEVKAMKAKLEANRSKMSNDNITVAEGNIRAVERASSEWMGTWGGVKQRMQPDGKGGVTALEKFDTVQVPISNMRVAGRDLSFWINDSADQPTPVVAAAPTAEEPF